MKQWFLAITKYADKLENDVSDLNWPEYIKTSQKNWI
jgi:leucyl-tRNA synthetase